MGDDSRSPKKLDLLLWSHTLHEPAGSSAVRAPVMIWGSPGFDSRFSLSFLFLHASVKALPNLCLRDKSVEGVNTTCQPE